MYTKRVSSSWMTSSGSFSSFAFYFETREQEHETLAVDNYHLQWFKNWELEKKMLTWLWGYFSLQLFLYILKKRAKKISKDFPSVCCVTVCCECLRLFSSLFIADLPTWRKISRQTQHSDSVGRKHKLVWNMLNRNDHRSTFVVFVFSQWLTFKFTSKFKGLIGLICCLLQVA